LLHDNNSVGRSSPVSKGKHSQLRSEAVPVCYGWGVTRARHEPYVAGASLRRKCKGRRRK